MVQKIGGSRRKSRSLFTKHARQKGKIPTSKYFQEFKESDVVLLAGESAVQKGLYHSRFHSRTGVVKGKRGACYEIAIMDKHKEKMLIVHPIHLRKI
ncbi:50S ribosomal protein L21e [Candidatus Woesearchaeota archaeon]|nr:50S ribosomal protein L21e [Candidatus Woesearchaeota archaeon]